MLKKLGNINLIIKIIAGFVIIPVLSLVNGIAFGRDSGSGFGIALFLIIVVLTIFMIYAITKSISNAIHDVIRDLGETSSNLKTLSGELTSSGHKLAEGSAEQASSIQETSSTLEESSSMVHQTTQNTKEADVLAKQTKQAADDGNVEMSNMITSMGELKKSGDEIAKIIKVIDEIAFQTNILSLNAAVEAARAGEAGKGFAVVAEEVRNLAQRSAQAAKDTTHIIESNISLSEKCLKITEKVGGSLAGIKDDTHKVSELLDEISTASQEQEIGITQIHKAVSQMETVLQDNALTAQESATSADSLELYSGNLQHITKKLALLIGEETSESETNKKNRTYTNTTKTKSKIKTLNDLVGSSKKEEKKAFPVSKALNSKKEVIAKKEEKPEVISLQEEMAELEATQNKAQITDNGKINPEDIIPLDDF
ncbi:hypothetical protein KBA27_00825 [bacterium]|nr:hypothetical protein [bacterium]